MEQKILQRLKFVTESAYIGGMKQISLPIVLAAFLVVPAASAEEKGGASLMERGADLFFRGLTQEMAPALEDLQELMGEIGPSVGQFLSQMGPALAEISDQIEDWSAYEMPEILPNGDIIIRKKPVIAPPPHPKGGDRTVRAALSADLYLKRGIKRRHQ